MSDSVNKPSHYAFSEIECIDYLRAIVPLRSFIDHCRMSAIAYITRSPHKGSEVEDIDKAINYLQRARNEAEKAIEAAESNRPETPDSSSGKAIPIPSGWRELEPDEIPLATDMHEWMGGWIVRTTDSGQPYKWHDHRNIRKIETPKPEPLAIPEGWRELEADEMPKVTDLYENEGVWRNRINDSSIEYARYEVRHIRKIEIINPSETPNSSTWIPKVGDKVRVVRGFMNPIGEVGIIKDFCPVVNGNFSILAHEGRCTLGWFKKDDVELIEAFNSPEAPNSSIPDPGPGYRLLSKDPPEQVVEGDEFLDLDGKWIESENWRTGSVQCSAYYRRKIEPTEWIPKVGDKVRLRVPVLYPTRDSCNYEGRITEISQSGRFTIFFASEDQRIRGWVKPKDLYLIEAAS